MNDCTVARGHIISIRIICRQWLSRMVGKPLIETHGHKGLAGLQFQAAWRISKGLFVLRISKKEFIIPAVLVLTEWYRSMKTYENHLHFPRGQQKEKSVSIPQIGWSKGRKRHVWTITLHYTQPVLSGTRPSPALWQKPQLAIEVLTPLRTLEEKMQRPSSEAI